MTAAVGARSSCWPVGSNVHARARVQAVGGELRTLHSEHCASIKSEDDCSAEYATQ